MILRSSSSPVPSSWLPHSSESDLVPKTTAVLNQSQPLADADHLHSSSRSRKKNAIPHSKSIKIRECDRVEEPQRQASPSVRELFWSSGLDRGVVDDGEEEGGAGKKDGALQTLVMGGGGEGCDGGHGTRWDYSEGSSYGRDSTDAYYRKMIEANPDNALLLGNYARFLKEVCGDYPKAEEYLERAILANPGDGDVLSLYADLIWQTQKNADRAEGYFDQAVKRNPNDCYVLASYAKFLWDAEEDEEDKDSEHKSDHSHAYPPDRIHRAIHHPRLPAAT